MGLLRKISASCREMHSNPIACKNQRLRVIILLKGGQGGDWVPSATSGQRVPVVVALIVEGQAKCESMTLGGGACYLYLVCAYTRASVQTGASHARRELYGNAIHNTLVATISPQGQLFCFLLFPFSFIPSL